MQSVRKYMREDSEPRAPHPDELDAPTLFPYKITDGGLMVHVDFGFFENLRLRPQDYVRIEATTKGIELTPIEGNDSLGWVQPYRVKKAE